MSVPSITVAAMLAIRDWKAGSFGLAASVWSKDTAAALRGMELNVEAVLKATKVDGIYTADPNKDPYAERYERLLREHRAVDFDAMLAAPLRLFREHPGILDRCRETYRWIVADECQDLSPSQCATLRLLAGERGNLTVVGDACQNVYAWRGADASFLLGFSAAYPAARVVALTENFRSTGSILAVANALGAALPYGHRLWTANPPGPPPIINTS